MSTTKTALPELAPPKKKARGDQVLFQAKVPRDLYEKVEATKGDYSHREIMEWALRAWLAKVEQKKVG